MSVHLRSLLARAVMVGLAAHAGISLAGAAQPAKAGNQPNTSAGDPSAGEVVSANAPDAVDSFQTPPPPTIPGKASGASTSSAIQQTAATTATTASETKPIDLPPPPAAVASPSESAKPAEPAKTQTVSDSKKDPEPGQLPVVEGPPIVTGNIGDGGPPISEMIDAPVVVRKQSPRIGLRHNTGPGIGYQESYTTFEGFIPLFESSGRHLTFLDTRLLLSNDVALGANLGIGHRFLVEGDGSDLNKDKIVGVYGYFDNRDTGTRTFSQFTLGLDLVEGSNTEARVNVYLPVGSTRKVSGYRDPFFQGTSLIFQRDVETAMAGFDMEWGVLNWTGDVIGLRGYAGWYHFQGEDGPQLYGARGRISMDISQRLWLELAVQNDRVFDTTVVFNVAYRFGNRRENRGSNWQLTDQIARPIERLDNIVVANQTMQELAMSTTTGAALNILHVGSATVSGNGTYESPFESLTQAESASQAGDIIFVRQGASALSVGDGIVLKENQRLLGEGMQHAFASEQGIYFLPGATSGSLPAITGTGTVVTLASGSEVAGLDIVRAGGPAIQGVNVNDVAIHHNTIRDSSGDAIMLKNIGGNSYIETNTITNTGMGANGGRAIAVDLIDGATVDIVGNTIQDTAHEAIAVTAGRSGVANVSIQENLIQRSGMAGSGAAAVALTATGEAGLGGLVYDNTIADNYSDGVAIKATGSGETFFDLDSNIISDNRGAGVSLVSSGSSAATIYVRNSNFENNGADAVSIRINGSTDLYGEIHHNIIRNNGGHGVLIASAGSSMSEFLLGTNQIENNAFHGIDLSSNGASTLTVDTSDSLISGNKIGFNASASGSSVLKYRVAQSVFQNNLQEGMRLISDGMSQTSAIIGVNDFTHNHSAAAGSALTARADDSGTFLMLLTGNHSDGAYDLIHAGSSVFKVEDSLSTNTGAVNQTGLINIVPMGTNFP